MTTHLDVDGTLFTFVAAWTATQYDDWGFYRNKMSKLQAKGVDVVALGNRELHLIEVKDYTHPDTETIPLRDLPTTVAAKARDTLAGLAAAQFNADDATEQSIASQSMSSQRVFVTFHIDLPKNKGGRLRNPAGEIVALRQSLRRLVKAIDPHARVDSRGAKRQGWST